MKIHRFVAIGMIFSSLLLITACQIRTPQAFTPEPQTTPFIPTATATSTPPIKNTTLPTVAPTRTATTPPVLTATPTNGISGFQQMIRSMPTAAYVASHYGDSVEIIYYDSPVRINNLTFSFTHEMESGLYLDKRIDSENHWAVLDGYHPDPDYTLAMYVEFVDPEKTLAEVKTATLDELLASAQQFGTALEQSSEIITVDTQQAVITYVIMTNEQGYLEFLRLDSLHPHVQGGVLEVSIMTAFLRENEDDLADQAAEVENVLHDLFSSFETRAWENNVTYDYTLYTGVCPTETDESYGYTQENPIRMVLLNGSDFMSQAFAGPYMANAYFETLLYEGEAITFVREGSIPTEDTILDAYRVSAPGMTDEVILYVDQYSQGPYTVPVGFQCSGLMYPDLFIEGD